MSHESMPQPEGEKENLDIYFKEIKGILVEKTLQYIQLAPEHRKSEALEAALNFYACLETYATDPMKYDQVMLEDAQKIIDQFAERAGLAPGLVSINKLEELKKEALQE